MEGHFNYNHSENILDSFESTENALRDSFKGAALTVTTLYKDALVQNRKAYAAGYQQALQDLYEFLSAQPENGYIPVNDVLGFARQRNNQLTSEMGYSTAPTTSTAAAATTSNSSSSNTAPTTPTTTTSATNNNNTTTTAASNQNTHAHSTHMKSNPTFPNNKIVINPFQIDPHTQFTFTHESQPSVSFWDQAAVINECNKRRLPEVTSFMGRSMNLDNWHEPAFKRGKTRREELLAQQVQLQQQQLQVQHELQQQQQQQQQQQLQQQQQQQQLQQHHLQLHSFHPPPPPQ